jgi:GxxExxY protein
LPNCHGISPQGTTREIIAAAIVVHQELRTGLGEKFYERALCIEFAERGIHFDQQLQFSVHYKQRPLGSLIPDLVVEKCVIVDTKVVDSFTPAHEAQMLGYLNITGMDVALLLNFKTWPLGKKRVIRPGYPPSRNPFPDSSL